MTGFTSPNDPRQLGLRVPSVSILCGTQSPARHAAMILRRSGLQLDPGASTKLIIDSPIGFALHKLETLDRRGLHLVVSTSSPCVEYWEDLWSLKPQVLLVGEDPKGNLARAIARASNGERYRVTPRVTTSLSGYERALLRYIAYGWASERIACELDTQEKTVRNTLTRVYQKLHVTSRTEAALYYWGIQQVLAGMAPPVDFADFAEPDDLFQE